MPIRPAIPKPSTKDARLKGKRLDTKTPRQPHHCGRRGDFFFAHRLQIFVFFTFFKVVRPQIHVGVFVHLFDLRGIQIRIRVSV